MKKLLKEFLAYSSELLTIGSNQTASGEVKIYEDIYVTRLCFQVIGTTEDNVLVELENYLNTISLSLLKNDDEEDFHQFILPSPQIFTRGQALLFNITNKEATPITVKVYLQGYKVREKELDIAKYRKPKVKLIADDVVIPAHGTNNNTIYEIKESILVDEITKIVTDSNNVFVNFQDTRTGKTLWRDSIPFVFLKDNSIDSYDFYSPMIFEKGDSIRILLQNTTATEERVSISLHGKEFDKNVFD